MKNEDPCYRGLQEYMFFKHTEAGTSDKLKGMKTTSLALIGNTYFASFPRTLEKLEEHFSNCDYIRGRALMDGGKNKINFFERTFPKTAQKVIATLGLR